MSNEEFSVKGAAPMERARPPAGGFFDYKKILLLGASILAVGGLAAWGMTVQGEEEAEVKLSDVRPANINVENARPSLPVDTGTEIHLDTGEPETGGQATKETAPPKRRGPPEGWKKTSPVVMRGNRSQSIQQAAQDPQQGRQQVAQNGGYPGQAGYGGAMGYEGEYGGEQGMRQGSNKQSFYAGGAGGGDLDMPGELLPELPGCVLKAGTYIPLQNRSAVRTALPGRVLAYVYNVVEGVHYLGDGQVERCTAIRPMSTVLSEINASGVERGDLRIQACALRLDLVGGGRRPLGCQPAHGADGGAGIEGESDYAVGGIATGILIEAALASARGLTGLIGGPAGIAVQVGANGISDVGSEYVRNELRKPPVLTMKAGAIWGIQLNADMSFPLID